MDGVVVGAGSLWRLPPPQKGGHFMNISIIVWVGVEEEGINTHEMIKQKNSDLCKAPPQ